MKKAIWRDYKSKEYSNKSHDWTQVKLRQYPKITQDKGLQDYDASKENIT